MHTVDSALRTDDPVLVTIDNAPAAAAFGYPLAGPVAADWSMVAGIRPRTPAQGAVVSSPVQVTGRADAFKGTFQWQVEQDDTVVKKGFYSGSSGMSPYSFTIDLPAGDYTLKLWENNAAHAGEGLAADVGVVYTDITVE